MFGLSKRELESKFTRSELVLLAWRSQEQSAMLDASLKKNKGGSRTPSGSYEEGVPEGLPPHFYNERGEVDLRKVTGKEAYRYFSSLGIKLPIMTR